MSFEDYQQTRFRATRPPQPTRDQPLQADRKILALSIFWADPTRDIDREKAWERARGQARGQSTHKKILNGSRLR